MELNTNLKHQEGPYSVVLPVCKACLENGCNIIVRAARQNAQAKQATIDDMAAREAGRQERVDIEADATPAATPVATPATIALPKPKSNKRIECVLCFFFCLSFFCC